MKKIGLMALIVMATLFCRARLGETNAQIYDRYGAVQRRVDTGTNTWQGAYLFKNYGVLVYFRDNVSEGEMIVPKDNQPFSDDERQSLMTTIGGPGKWVEQKSSEDRPGRMWINQDNKAAAYLKDSPTVGLMVGTHEFWMRGVSDQQNEQKQKTDGF